MSTSEVMLNYEIMKFEEQLGRQDNKQIFIEDFLFSPFHQFS